MLAFQYLANVDRVRPFLELSRHRPLRLSGVCLIDIPNCLTLAEWH